jgi:hypothetical protein
MAARAAHVSLNELILRVWSKNSNLLNTRCFYAALFPGFGKHLYAHLGGRKRLSVISCPTKEAYGLAADFDIHQRHGG